MNGETVPQFRSMISDFFDNTERFFEPDFIGGRMLTSSMPLTNITENNNAYTIELAAPGLSKKDFHIDIQDNILSISVEKEEETKTGDENYTRREYSYNAFSRSFNLPDSVKNEDIKAEYENGVLKLLLPKKAEARKTSRKEISVA